MTILFIIFWLMCSYLSFAGIVTYFITKYHCVSSVKDELLFSLLMSIGGPMSFIASYITTYRFKYGLNWIKAIKIARARMQIKKCKFDE